MNSWREKVLPKIKNILSRNTKKKAAAAEATKAFEESKEAIEKDIEEKQVELRAKVEELWKSLDAETKKTIKNPTKGAVKKYATSVQKLLEELSKLEFPGAKACSEATVAHGVTSMYTSIAFELKKVSTLVPEEEQAKEEPKVETESREVEITAEKEKETTEIKHETTTGETSKEEIVETTPVAVAETTPVEKVADKEVVVAEEKKEELKKAEEETTVEKKEEEAKKEDKVETKEEVAKTEAPAKA